MKQLLCQKPKLYLLDCFVVALCASAPLELCASVTFTNIPYGIEYTTAFFDQTLAQNHKGSPSGCDR